MRQPSKEQLKIARDDGEGWEMKIIWIYLESLKPFRWGVRYGNQWFVVKNIIVNIPLKTQKNNCQPKGCLKGVGILKIKNDVATIKGEK